MNTNPKKRPAAESPAELEILEWTEAVHRQLLDFSAAIKAGKPIRPLKLPPLPDCATPETVAALIMRMGTTHWNFQTRAAECLRAGGQLGRYFLFDHWTALQCLVQPEQGATAEIEKARLEVAAFKSYFGDLAPAVAKHLSPDGSVLHLLVELTRLPGYAHSDCYMQRLIRVVMQNICVSKADAAALVILWERVFFGKRSGTDPPSSGFEVQRAVAEAFACTFLMPKADHDISPTDGPAAWALYWGAIIVPSRVGAYDRDCLGCSFRLGHLVAGAEDPNAAWVLAGHEDGEDDKRVRVKEEDMCFDNAVKAIRSAQ